jgi:hypothetical protein
MRTMKKLVLLLSVVALSYALQAGDSDCPKNKAACDKTKAATCEKVKTGTCDKAKAEAKGCCPAAKKVEEAAKKPLASPKATS